jgi:hypothetical protein
VVLGAVVLGAVVLAAGVRGTASLFRWKGSPAAGGQAVRR